MSAESVVSLIRLRLEKHKHNLHAEGPGGWEYPHVHLGEAWGQEWDDIQLLQKALACIEELEGVVTASEEER